MVSFTRYQQRNISFKGIIHTNDFWIKSYDIYTDNGPLTLEQKTIITNALPEWISDLTDHKYKNHQTGILIHHAAKDGIYAVLCLWAEENMMMIHSYYSSDISKEVMKRISDDGMMVCIWELEVLWFERQAWIDTVLNNEKESDQLALYLERFYQHQIIENENKKSGR